MQQGSPVVEAVYVNRLLTSSLPRALPPTEQHRSYTLHLNSFCPPVLIKASCDVMSDPTPFMYGTVTSAQGEKKLNGPGRGLHPYCF